MPDYHFDQLRVGASVWTEEYKNGKIVFIDRHDQVVDCKFYNSGTTVSFDLDLFSGCYDERLNQWVIPHQGMGG